MAQYFTDFSEYTVDVAPSDWTKFFATDGLFEVRADAGATGGKVLHCEDQATSGLRGIGWDSVLADADRDDAEIVVRYRLTGTLTYALFNALLRGSGASHTVGSYYAGIQTNNQRRIYKRVSGTGTTIANTTFSPAVGQWLWMRVRMIGDALKVRHWIDGDAEPTETWTFESTETEITAAGYIGIAVGAGTGSPKTVAEVDLIGFGTNGDSAPTGSGSTPVAFTGTVPAQSWVEDSAITPLDLSSYFSGDLTPFAYAVTTGTLPAGLSLNASTGVISGTPTTPASAVSIVVTATDDGTNTAPTNAFDITITAAAAVVKGVEVILHDRATLTPRASVTGITARWWDSPTAAGAPLLKTDTASTDVAGLLALDIDSVTSLSVAALGYLVLYKAGAGADTDLHFAGRVAVSDIA